MKETYTVKYRQPGDLLSRTLRGVWRDEVVYAPGHIVSNPDGTHQNVPGPPLFRAFTDDSDRIHYVSIDAYVCFLPDRQKVIGMQMSKEAGTPVMRN